jgi:hypothetical protein
MEAVKYERSESEWKMTGNEFRQVASLSSHEPG